jgi:hypothetical protein
MPLTTRLGQLFRNPDTGDVVVAQKPNLPLWVFLAATAVRLVFRPEGTLGATVRVVGTLAIVVWALLEIARGDSPFRRVLGAVVLTAVTIGVLIG